MILRKMEQKQGGYIKEKERISLELMVKKISLPETCSLCPGKTLSGSLTEGCPWKSCSGKEMNSSSQ